MEGVLLRAIQMQCSLLDLRLQKKTSLLRQTTDDAAQLQRELDAIARRISWRREENIRLYEAYTEGRLTKDAFLKEKRALQQETEREKVVSRHLQQKLEASLARQTALECDAADLSAVPHCSGEDGLTPALLAALVRQITVYQDGAVEIAWNFRDTWAADEDRRDETP